jgi:hypothetical protein
MTTTVSTRDQLLLDVFTTALEGGIGYWSGAMTYRWSTEAGEPAYRSFHADVVDLDEQVQHINRAVVVRGMLLAATEYRNRLAWSSEPPPLVITQDTDWDFDAGDADMIVQLGLFGDVVYG